ncbi:multimerin-2 [Rhynchocyon petersi]
MILMLLVAFGAPLGWGLLGTCAQDPGARFSGLHPPGHPETEAEDTSNGSDRRNQCPYQMYRLVTFAAACKTEKFLIHSQQPCPQWTLNCQQVKVMYRMAPKLVYRVKQKVLASVVWRCCPGYSGPDCQHHAFSFFSADPMALSESAGPGLESSSLELGSDVSLDLPDAEIRKVPVPQEQWLQDLQNDLHQIVDSPQGLWKAPEDNFTTVTAATNQTELELPSRRLEQALLPYVEAFLQVQFNPIWRDFNESLHGLSQSLRNLSLRVEGNRLAIERVQESTVARADFQELGAKFENKVQETAHRVGQLRQDVEDRLHAQHLSVNRSLEDIRASVDTKVKRLHKAQGLPDTNDSVLVAATAAAKPEPESLQARLGQLQRDLSGLLMESGRREEELQRALTDIRTNLAQHGEEIKELYSESDETFDQIRRVERQVEELQVNHTALRELRVVLMEKSLIMEENKEETERRLLELNLTLQHLQDGHVDLIKNVKDCNCPELPLDPDVVGKGARGATEAPEESQASPEELPTDCPSVRSLRAAMEALALEVDAQRAAGERSRADTTRLRSQLHALLGDVVALRVAEGQARSQLRRLDGYFVALLEDVLRHEAVLAALFGEEILEVLAEEASGPLPLSYEQIRLGLQEAAAALREQELGWTALAARISVLERAAAGSQGGGRPEAKYPGPGFQEPREEGPGPKGGHRAALDGQLQLLGAQVRRVARCCEAAVRNESLVGLQRAISTTQQGLEQQQLLFHGLFANFQGLVAANVSIDLGKLQAVLSRKGKKQQKGLQAPRRREKKQAEPWMYPQGQGHALVTDLIKAGSPVAFYASCSEGMSAPKIVKFNTTYINIGSNYFEEYGYFQAPERGVYLFAVSIEFDPGPGTGKLVFGNHHQTPVYTTGDPRSGSTTTTFAMAELQKGERVWFELTQGSVTKRSPPSSAFGGFLIFKT